MPGDTVKTFVAIRDSIFMGKYWRRDEEYLQGPGMPEPTEHFCPKRSSHVREVEVESLMAKALEGMQGAQISAYIQKHYGTIIPPGMPTEKIKAHALQIIHDPVKLRLPDSVVEGEASTQAGDPEATAEAGADAETEVAKAAAESLGAPAPSEKKFSAHTPDDIDKLSVDDIVTMVKTRFSITLENDGRSKLELMDEACKLEDKMDL